jgi:hypothetical protein
VAGVDGDQFRDSGHNFSTETTSWLYLDYFGTCRPDATQWNAGIDSDGGGSACLATGGAAPPSSIKGGGISGGSLSFLSPYPYPRDIWKRRAASGGQ